MLNVSSLQCRYDDQQVVKDISFGIESGELCCLLGPSGCGKTTVLRALAGFQPINGGEIRLGEEIVSRPGLTVAPEERNIGMVFQDYALFPHLSIADNIRFGLDHHKSERREEIIRQVLELVHMDTLGDRYPHELSGGQQQRVALIRALARGPKLLLLDEPFSNLDAELRKRLNLEVRDILKEYGISAVLVTHDQEEAFTFGDSIGVLHEGVIQQWDTPFNLYHKPVNKFVANFHWSGLYHPRCQP